MGNWIEHVPDNAAEMCCNPANPKCMGGGQFPAGTETMTPYLNGTLACDPTNCTGVNPYVEALNVNIVAGAATIVTREQCTGAEYGPGGEG